MDSLGKLIEELTKNLEELPWLEFKHDNYDPHMIGKDICALANAAVLYERQCAYMLWGIDDQSHEIVGTEYDLHRLKKGNEELENWLRSLLSSNVDFSFQSVEMPGGTVGILTVQRAVNYPASFEKIEYIRIGSYTKKLKDHLEIQGRLWRLLQADCFEEQFAKQNLELNTALGLLGHTAYFDILEIPQPTTPEGVAHYLIEEKCLVRQDNGLYAITNLGAILFAKNLEHFDRLSRKALRIVQYEGKDKMTTLRRENTNKGYALGFDDWMKYIEALLPSREVIEIALRETKKAYPAIAVREAVANALIHQDFGITGSGVVVEIFSNRIEITNPGCPLVNPFRIVDNPPLSRNEKLSGLMRQLRMCEEAGTGWDKMVIGCERHQLPAPRINVYENGTRVTLFAEIPFSNLTWEDRLWSCYLHSCVKYLRGEFLTNRSLRERFGVPERSSGTISRLIKGAVERKLIKPLDESAPPRHMKYMPVWA